MSRLLRLISCGLLVSIVVFGGTARAQDPEPEPDSVGDTNADKKPDDDKKDDDNGTSKDDSTGRDPGDAPPAVGSLADYPQERIKRPRVLPHMMLEAFADLDFTHFDTMLGSDTVTVLGFGAALGLLHGKGEVGLATGLQVDPDTDLAPTTLFGAYSIREEATWAVAGELDFLFDFRSGNDTFDGFALGARFIYRLNDQMALLAGRDLLHFNSGPDHTDINLNVGFLYQFDATWSAEAHTQLASLGLFGDGNDTTVIFADSTPLTLVGYYSHGNKLDAFLSFGFDFNSIGDVLKIIAGIRYRFGL